MIRSILLFSSFLAAAVSSEVDEPSARLLLFKSSKTSPVVEGKDYNIQYEIFNSGDLTAHDVQISDRYDISSFDIVNFENDEGTISVYIEEIAPGGSSSFNISVVPKLFGIYESTRARMRYVSGEVDSESEDDLESAIRNGYSSTVGRVKIISAEEYSQNQSMEATRTAFTAALVIVPVLFALFYFNRPEPTVAKKEKAAKKKR